MHIRLFPCGFRAGPNSTCHSNPRSNPPSHYSHPRSRNASRSTPGGAYQPSAPYRAPMLNAASLFP